MLELQEINIKTDKSSVTIPLNEGVVALRGSENMGKSSFISLIYVLLGSKSTLRKDKNDGTSFNIYRDSDFGISKDSFFSLKIKVNNVITEHKIIVCENDELEFRIDGKSVSGPDDFKKNYVSLSSEMKVFDFIRGKTSKYSRYNVDLYFRAFPNLVDIFSPSPSTPIINDNIKSFLMGGSSTLMALTKERNGLYAKEKKLKKLSNSLSSLKFEAVQVEKALEKMKKSEGGVITEEIASDVKKIKRNKDKIFLLGSMLENFTDINENESTFANYFKIIDKIDFKSIEVKSLFTDFLETYIKNTIGARKSIYQIRKNISELETKNDLLKRNIQIWKENNSILNEREFLFERAKYIDSEINGYNFNEKDLVSVKKRILYITKEINEISDNSTFIERGNRILEGWEGVRGSYTKVTPALLLKRTYRGSSTTGLLGDKYISFIVALENMNKNFSNTQFLPSIISINNIAMDNTEEDRQKFKGIIDILDKQLVKSRNFGISIVVQDKHKQMKSESIQKYDFDKLNPFSKL